MDIPDYLEQQIKDGTVALCLGSGASLGARDPKGEGPPTAKELAKLLANKFLGGKYKDSPLAQVAEYATRRRDGAGYPSCERSMQDWNAEGFQCPQSAPGITTCAKCIELYFCLYWRGAPCNINVKNNGYTPGGFSPR